MAYQKQTHFPEAGLQIEQGVVSLRRGAKTELFGFRREGAKLLWQGAGGAVPAADAAAVARALGGLLAEVAATEAKAVSVQAGSATVREAAATSELGGGAFAHATHVGDRVGIASAVREYLTAVVRVGVRRAQQAVSVEDARSRLGRRADAARALGVLRWLYRCDEALTVQDLPLLVALLEAGRRLANGVLDEPGATGPKGVLAEAGASGPSAWGAGSRSSEAGAVAGEWFDDASSTSDEAFHERTFIEVGRERLDGNERYQLLRRYLVEQNTGELFREEQSVGDSRLSFGPCPRIVNASLAMPRPSLPPQRLRVLQYTVRGGLDERRTLDRVEALAEADFAKVHERYAECYRAAAGLAEPVALVRVSLVRWDARVVLMDPADRCLALGSRVSSARLRALEGFLREKRCAWVLGRLHHQGRALYLNPISAAARDQADDLRFWRG